MDNVSELKIENRAEEVALYRAIIEQSLVGIGIIQDGKIVFASPYLLKAFGYDGEELIGKEARSFIHPDDYRWVKERASEMLSRGLPIPYEYRLQAKNGDYRWVMEVVTLITFKGRRAVLTTAIDVTEKKKTEMELGAAKDMLLKAERLASVATLAAGVTHEILNPLNIIAVYCQMLEDPQISLEERKRMLAICRRQVERIVKITKDLNKFAQVHEHTMEVLDVREVMNSVLNMMAANLRHAQVEVTRDYGEKIPPVLADPNALGQVMVNIISNAIDAMEKKEKRFIEIRIGQEEKEGKRWVYISCADTGSGIAPEIKARIFTPFFTTKEVGKGTGMGLAVAYGIIQEHGGTIDVEDSPWGGAKLIVRLPVRQ